VRKDPNSPGRSERDDDPTEVGEEVGLSRNSMARPTDKSGPRRTGGRRL